MSLDRRIRDAEHRAARLAGNRAPADALPDDPIAIEHATRLSALVNVTGTRRQLQLEILANPEASNAANGLARRLAVLRDADRMARGLA
jgi:hypothetical protein